MIIKLVTFDKIPSSDITMKELSKILTWVLVLSCSNLVLANSNAPIFMWNINTDLTVNALEDLNSKELAEKLFQTKNSKLVIIFMQDDLAVEDFKSGDLATVQSLKELENKGSFFAPSVSETENLPNFIHLLGYKTIHVKSHEDLPTSAVTEPTVLIIDLPATVRNNVRSESLQTNDNVIGQVYEVLRSQQPDAVGIFTAKTNSMMEKSKIQHRTTRSILEASQLEFGYLYNGTEIYMFIEDYPLLHINNKTMGLLSNFTLNNVISVTGSNMSLRIEYGPSVNHSGNGELISAVLKFQFMAKAGYWYIDYVDAEVELRKDSSTDKFSVNLQMNPYDISTPLGFSYHCSRSIFLASVGYSLRNDTSDTMAFETRGFQLQPFHIMNDRFGDGYDCEGFFTESIWAGIFIGLIMAAILAWAVSMLADVKTPDRFDDPKGKTITVSATE